MLPADAPFPTATGLSCWKLLPAILSESGLPTQTGPGKVSAWNDTAACPTRTYGGYAISCWNLSRRLHQLHDARPDRLGQRRPS